MRNWYRFANNELAMARDIAVWLQQSAHGNTDFMTMQDDVTMRMSGMDDPALLQTAVEQAAAMVAQQQGGNLMPVQQEMIQALLSRTQGMPEEASDDPAPDATDATDGGLGL